MVGYSLADHGQCCTGRPDRCQTTKNVEERLVDCNALQMSKLTASSAKLRLHDDVWLERAAKPTLALSRTASKGRNFSVVLGQQCDDAIGIAIVDGP